MSSIFNNGGILGKNLNFFDTRLNPPTGPETVTCGTAAENGTVVINAPAGHVFTRVVFASYGNPTGSCPTYSTGGCHATNSVSIVEGYALGQTSVSIPATNAVFGDPCPGTPKQLYVALASQSTTDASKRNSGIWSLPSVVDYNTRLDSEELYTNTSGSDPTSVSFITSATSTTSSLTIPSSAQAGDLAILFDAGRTTSTISAPSLPGWNLIAAAGGDVNTYQFIYYKKLTASEPNTTLTLRTAATGGSHKAILIYRPNADYSVTILSATSINTAGNPAAQSLVLAGQSRPVIGFAGYLSTGAVSPRTSSLTMSEINVGTTNYYLKHISYNSSGSDGTVDMDDEGTNNLVSGSIRIDPAANLKRSNIWDLTQTLANLKSPKLEYLGYNFNNTVTTSYTFSNQPIGGPGLIVVAAQHENGTTATISSVTIAGITATLAVGNSGVLSGARLYYAVVTSGTTATISITTSGNASRMAIGVYRITNYTSTTPVETKLTEVGINGTGVTNSGFTSIQPGDVVISALTLGATCGARWSNTIGRYDEAPGNGTGTAGAAMIASAYTSSISASYGLNTTQSTLITAVWR